MPGNTAPITTKGHLRIGCEEKRTASIGLTACRMAGAIQMLIEAKQAYDHEPHHHDRTEQLADALGAKTLDHEQADQDRKSRRHDKMLEIRAPRASGPSIADSTENRGRNDAVAVQQRGTDHAEHYEDRKPGAVWRPCRSPPGRAAPGCRLRPRLSARRTKITYFRDTIAISAQRNQRDDAEHLGRGSEPDGRGRSAPPGKGVERAGADIAKHHAERGQRQKTTDFRHDAGRRGDRVWW